MTRGYPLPLGASRAANGINFAVVSRHATDIRLVLSDPGDAAVVTESWLDPRRHRTGNHWHVRVDGQEPCRPDFSFESRALTMDGRRCDRPGVVDRDLYIALNAHWDPQVFRVPASPSGRPWRRAVDTALAPPEDALGPDQGPIVPVLHPYRLEARSIIILVSEDERDRDHSPPFKTSTA